MNPEWKMELQEWLLRQINELKKNYTELLDREEQLIKLKRQIYIEIEELTQRLRKYLLEDK